MSVDPKPTSVSTAAQDGQDRCPGSLRGRYARRMPPVRTPLLSLTLDDRPLIEGVQITEIELPPNEPTGRHVHPVPVVGYVLAGRIHFEIEGEAPRVLTAGSVFYEPAGVRILRFDNASDVESATFVAVYLRGSGQQELIRMLDET